MIIVLANRSIFAATAGRTGRSWANQKIVDDDFPR
jgi:hypothetical protein